MAFYPWVGKNYWDGFINGSRVLILGESHYGEPGQQTPEFTSYVVGKVKEGLQEKGRSFFTKTHKLVAGIQRQVSTDERVAFWDSVAFYNFIPVFVGSGPRCGPTKEMWKAAAQPFLTTLCNLQPDFLIVLGVRLGKHLPQIPENIRDFRVPHPSSGRFHYDPWQRLIQSALLS